MAPRFSRPALPAILLLTGLTGAVILAASVGSTPLSLPSVLRFFLGLPGDEKTRTILLHIRLPRILVTLLSGSSLAVAGAVMQGLFRNPMASPDILGISAGGSLGALLAITSGLTGLFLPALPLAAILGCLASALIIWRLAALGRGTSLLYLILAGMAVSSFLNGLISLVLLFTGEHQVSQYLYWTMGSLSGRRWEHVLLAAPLMIPAQALLFFLADDLDLFLLGEDSAHSSGLPVESRKRIFLALAAGLTGLSVSISGTIGFIGLMVPHLIRLLTGPGHRRLLPLSALGGGLLLLLCDTLGRSLIPYHEIRAGIITALLGGPFFLFLLLRRQRSLL